MPLTVHAALDLATVSTLLDGILPVTIDLDDDPKSNRSIEIARAQLVELVAGAGLRLRTSARVQWQIAGVTVPVTISSATILLSVRFDATGTQLVLSPRIEDADLKNVPALLDRTLVDKINERLAKKPIVWGFAQTLALRFGLPSVMHPSMRFAMDAHAPSLDISNERIRIGLELPMSITR